MKKHGSEVAQENADTVSEAAKGLISVLESYGWLVLFDAAQRQHCEKIVANRFTEAVVLPVLDAAARVEPATTGIPSLIQAQSILEDAIRFIHRSAVALAQLPLHFKSDVPSAVVEHYSLLRDEANGLLKSIPRRFNSISSNASLGAAPPAPRSPRS